MKVQYLGYLKHQFHKTVKKGCNEKGEITLLSIIEGQFSSFPRKYPMKLKVVKYKPCDEHE